MGEGNPLKPPYVKILAADINRALKPLRKGKAYPRLVSITQCEDRDGNADCLQALIEISLHLRYVVHPAEGTYQLTRREVCQLNAKIPTLVEQSARTLLLNKDMVEERIAKAEKYIRKQLLQSNFYVPGIELYDVRLSLHRGEKCGVGLKVEVVLRVLDRQLKQTLRSFEYSEADDAWIELADWYLCDQNQFSYA
jgi:hypothetical protein